MFPYLGQLHYRLGTKVIGDFMEGRGLELRLGEELGGLGSRAGTFSGKGDFGEGLLAVVDVWVTVE